MVARQTRLCTKCGKNRDLKFFKPKGRVCFPCQKQARRKNHADGRVRTYDITPDEYDAILKVQGGVCAICLGTRNYRLNIDHDHVAEQYFGTRRSVRGLLCRRCNKLLAVAGDDDRILHRAMIYLYAPPAHRVIPRKEAE